MIKTYSVHCIIYSLQSNRNREAKLLGRVTSSPCVQGSRTIGQRQFECVSAHTSDVSTRRVILIFYFYFLAVDASLHPDGECALTVAISLTMLLLSIERIRMPVGHLVRLYFLPVLPVAWT